jgi:branched-chain amino acid transport system ATP-binding protein
VFLQGAAAGEELASSDPGLGTARRPTEGATRQAGLGRARPQAQPVELEPVVLETRSLTKRFGGVTAVDEVSFELHEGEILGFIGPNGAGKTSLFDLISGFSVADSGHVVFRDLDVTGWSAHERAHLGLGRSFQDARLWPELTVAECLAVALHLEGETEAALPALLGVPRVVSSERMIHERVDELVDLMGLGAFRNKFVGELSTGSRRIVELACMLAHRPQVLLLDEPSSGIAQRETEALAPLIRRIRAQLGASILIIEHDIPLINDLADHMVGLDLGQVVAYGRPADVLSDPHVVASYLGTAAERLGVSVEGRATARKPPAAATSDALGRAPVTAAPAGRTSVAVSPPRPRRPLRTINGDTPPRAPRSLRAPNRRMEGEDTIATDVRQAMSDVRRRRQGEHLQRGDERDDDEAPVAHGARTRRWEDET